MAITQLHDLHRRRSGRNLGVGLCLVAFVAIVFGLSIVKITRDGHQQGFDHVVRPELTQPAPPK